MSRFSLAILLLFPLVTACGPTEQAGSHADETVLPAVAPGGGVSQPRPPDADGAERLPDWSAMQVKPVGPRDRPTLDLEGERPTAGGVIDQLSGTQQWVKTLGASGWDSVQQVARFDDDEVLVIGWIEGSVDFGGACGVHAPGARTPDQPFIYASYVARFSDDGSCTWIDTFDSDDAWPVAVAVDAAKNFFVVGMFNEEVRFGTGFDLKTSGNAYDLFIARYTDKGLAWTHKVTGQSDTWAYDATVIEGSVDGDLVLVGSFDGTVILEDSAQLTSSGGYDILVARFSAKGSLQFAKSYGGAGMDEAYAVATSGTDVVVGAYFDSASMPVGALPPLDNQGSFDAALIKLSGEGTPLWAQRFGGVGGDWISDVAVTGGDIAVVGGFRDTMSVAGLAELSATGTSAFLARLTGAGVGLWSHAVSSASGGALFTSVRANAAGDLYVATVIGGDASFGSTLVSPAAGGWSIVAARYAASGGETPLWTSQQDRSGQMTYAVLDITNKYVVLSADLLDNGGDMAFYGLEL